MLNDHWLRWFWLRRVPSVFFCIEGRERFGLIDECLGFGVTGFGSKYRYFDAVDASIF